MIRCIYALLLSLGLTTSPTQLGYGQVLTSLSREFQKTFQAQGWMLNAPMPIYGLAFAQAQDSCSNICRKSVPLFFRVNGIVEWNRDRDKYSLLDSLIVESKDIQDAMTYKILGLYDKEEETQIIDVYRWVHVKDTALGIYYTPGVRGEFVGGDRKLIGSLSTYLKTEMEGVGVQNSKVKVYFDAIKPDSAITVMADDSRLKEAFLRFFAEKAIKYKPGIRLGRPTYSQHVFDVKKTDSGFLVDIIGYQECFFRYVGSNSFYFIEPVYEQLKTELSFVYDSKWTEEEFMTSTDIRRIMERTNIPDLKVALKSFFYQEMLPFSSIYNISIVER